MHPLLYLLECYSCALIQVAYHSLWWLIFKPGVRRPQAGARLVLEIDPVRERLYVCVCVSAPEAINNYWRDVA